MLNILWVYYIYFLYLVSPQCIHTVHFSKLQLVYILATLFLFMWFWACKKFLYEITIQKIRLSFILSFITGVSETPNWVAIALKWCVKSVFIRLWKVVTLKGIVHPKISNSVIYSTLCCSKPVWFSFFRYLYSYILYILKNVGNQTFLVPIDFYCFLSELKVRVNNDKMYIFV